MFRNPFPSCISVSIKQTCAVLENRAHFPITSRDWVLVGEAATELTAVGVNYGSTVKYSHLTLYVQHCYITEATNRIGVIFHSRSLLIVTIPENLSIFPGG